MLDLDKNLVGVRDFRKIICVPRIFESLILRRGTCPPYFFLHSYQRYIQTKTNKNINGQFFIVVYNVQFKINLNSAVLLINCK